MNAAWKNCNDLQLQIWGFDAEERESVWCAGEEAEESGH